MAKSNPRYNPVPVEERRPLPKRCSCSHLIKAEDFECERCARGETGITYDIVAYRKVYAAKQKAKHRKWLREQLTETLKNKE